MKLMLKIVNVSFLDRYQISMLMNNGQTYMFDMRPKLDTVRFYDLNNWDIFSNGYVKNNQIICWNNGSEIHIDELLSDDADIS